MKNDKGLFSRIAIRRNDTVIGKIDGLWFRWREPNMSTLSECR